jgi:glycerol-3-phosphate acyltransferase PlsY
LFWPLGLVFVALWLAFAFTFRMSSLAGLATSALTPLWAYLLGRTDLLLPTALIAIAIWIMHRANIGRLMKGEEPKIDLQRRA